MGIVERGKSLLIASGSEWVLWVLVGLSVVSIAIIVERAVGLWRMRIDLATVRARVARALEQGGFVAARDVVASIKHPAGVVAMRMMARAEAGTSPAQAEDTMNAEILANRRALERRFSFLATLGANAPFIGLLGTVIGILRAFDDLGKSATFAASAASAAAAPQAVMSSIAEALVATAVGLAVAIPAVLAYNAFQRRVKDAMSDAQTLGLDVLAHLHGHEKSASSSGPRRIPAPADSGFLSYTGTG